MNTATVLVVGRDRLSRASLGRLFVGSAFKVISDIQEVPEIGSGAELGNAIDEAIGGVIDHAPPSSNIPDIVLLEPTGDDDDVLNALKRLRGIFPTTAAVVLSNETSMASLIALFAAGARGILTKDISRSALLHSLQLVMLGETVFPTALGDQYVAGSYGSPQGRPLRSGQRGGLSDRETDIVQCLLRGESNKLIANRFALTEATIKVHVKSVLRKIKVTNRTQAAIWAHNHGYLPIRSDFPVADGPTSRPRDFLA